ncbi:zinc ABC transporter substrate-binding protein ZnuA [Photobacterium damselae]|uniref:zinc ABC transporter substrate-binding protein ZnuA n=1 Tax=Photobacterium damselae TaxID=38293 RepID=UPI0009EF95CB|nr:zinc ABC transporter substrate-binding protein ZnuA [Photobacterium damselae]GAW44965.1 High-affinity zinc uptake system protein ZnuA precursor [Photobacterium damselae subsp. piscicida]
MRRLLSFCGAGAMIFSSLATAHELNVVTTVQPLNLIVSELTAGVAHSEAILPAGTSPHDYALRPSDVKKIKNADLVIWVGPQLESFLKKVLQGNSKNLALTEQAGIDFRHYGEEDEHEHEHEEYHHEDGMENAEHDHHDHEHHHEGIDPHVWLGPKQAIEVAKVITQQLVKQDPLHKEQYEANLSCFTSEVNQTITQLTNELKPLAGHGYYVFHDGYGYFEEQFGLKNLGHFTVEPDRRPGAKTLMNIRQALQAHQAYCVFSEPQFSPAVVDSVVNGTEVKVGTLDPMATGIVAGKGGYVRFLQQLGQSFTKCLK